MAREISPLVPRMRLAPGPEVSHFQILDKVNSASNSFQASIRSMPRSERQELEFSLEFCLTLFDLPQWSVPNPRRYVPRKRTLPRIGTGRGKFPDRAFHENNVRMLLYQK